MVRPFKVVLLGKTEEGYIWQYSFLVFARNKTEAVQLGVETAMSRRKLSDIRIFKVREYKKPTVWAELHGAWPEDTVLDELEEIGGYETLPKVQNIIEERV
uniref:Uncharacterized protein n=2 Tax=Thermococcus sp. CIR10 TaxID=1197731 RepID=L0B8I5_9EURY|nr:hypothetical protein c10-9 [Thermococcus sp. CIR10]